MKKTMQLPILDNQNQIQNLDGRKVQKQSLSLNEDLKQSGKSNLFFGKLWILISKLLLLTFYLVVLDIPKLDAEE